MSLILWSSVVAAAPQPAQDFSTAVTKAQAAHQQLAERLTTLRRQQQNELAEAFRAQTTLLQLAEWPEGLLTTGALLGNKPLPNALVQATGRQSEVQLATLSDQLKTYTQLKSQSDEQLASLTQLKDIYSGQTKRLTDLEKSALAAAKTEAEGLAAALTLALANPTAEAPPPPTVQPSLLPVPGRVLFGFHQPGSATTHTEGVTFEAPANSPVTALATGQVLYAGPFRNLGGLVIVKTGRLHYVYAGLATLTPQPGQTVKAGSILGQLPADNPARLYLEVRQSGRPIDPARVLTRR